MARLLPALILALCISLMRPAGADGLGVEAGPVIDAATASGLFDAADFEAVVDPHVGPLRIARPGPGDSGIAVILFEGEAGLNQVQISLVPPWDNLFPRVDLAAAIIETVAGPLPPAPSLVAGNDGLPLTPGGRFIFAMLSESWGGWPGETGRIVRAANGVAMVFEGVPPEFWTITAAPDSGVTDNVWPGEPGEPAALTQARRAIRAADYGAAHALLVELAAQDDPRVLTLLGDMYRLGQTEAVDQGAATNWYLAAARQRYGPAIYRLATMQNQGFGVLILNELSLPLLVDAATEDIADAHYILSEADGFTDYVRPENIEPIDQVRAAAELGLLMAQHDMALAYETGERVTADPVRAHAWALAALDNTEPGVAFIRSHEIADRTGAGLTPEQRAEAEAMARTLVGD